MMKLTPPPPPIHDNKDSNSDTKVDAINTGVHFDIGTILSRRTHDQNSPQYTREGKTYGRPYNHIVLYLEG